MTTTGSEFRDDTRARKQLAPEVLKQLNRIDGWKGTCAVLETLGVLALAIGLSLYFWTPWVVLPALVLIATRQQACFVLAHDAAHYRLYRSRWLNDLVGRLIASIVGISMCTYRVVHRLHHNHLYQERDPDIPLHGGYPRGRGYLIKKLAKDLAGLTAHKTYGYFFGNPALNAENAGANRPLDDTSSALRLAARRDRWLVVAVHLALPAAAFWAGYGLEYLLLWVLPLLTLLQAILRFRAICEHGAVADYASPLTAARTNLGPAPLIWLIFPHHVNYHIEHHLYPAIPHYNLPQCHRELVKTGALEAAEVSKLPSTVRKIFAEPRVAATTS